jgi:hypothetical protein
MLARKEMEEKLITHAWQDEGFKQELLSNPKAALEKKGISIPANIEVKVVEETPTALYLVLPMSPDQAKELSDAQLESVAGGVAQAIDIEIDW